MRPLRIGINALYLLPGQVGGTEIYLRCLLDAMSALESPHRFVIFTNRETGCSFGPRRPEWQVHTLPVHASFRPGRLLYEQLFLPGDAAREGVDVLFHPGFTAPIFPRRPQVTTFHDLQHVRHPEYFRWFDLPFWQFFLWAAAQRSSRIVAVSEPTRQDVLAHYRLDPGRVVTVWSGVDEHFFECASHQERGPVLLCASTTHPHKNHSRLLRAFAALRREAPEWKLMLTGVGGFVESQVRAEIRRLDLETGVVLTGWVPREQLYRLFAQAEAFVYPSRFEGFGMPVLEALAAGLPTACSSIEPLRTLAGSAAVLFDPEDDAQLLDALRRILFDAPLRERLRAAGPAQARLFSWRHAARQTLDVLEEVARPAAL
jgi:glycosyltransferase involved in cell wall biosynthesis